MIPMFTKMLTTKYKRFTDALDNNQKGFSKKIQGFGSSNTFIKVTGRYLKENFLFEELVSYGNTVNRHAITYVNQIIPPPFKKSCFEIVQNDLKLIEKMFSNPRFFYDKKYRDIPYNN